MQFEPKSVQLVTGQLAASELAKKVFHLPTDLDVLTESKAKVGSDGVRADKELRQGSADWVITQGWWSMV